MLLHHIKIVSARVALQSKHMEKENTFFVEKHKS